MAQKITTTFVLVLVLLLGGCSKYKQRVSKDVDLNAFHTIQLEDSFVIELMESNGNSMQIEAAEAYLDDVSFTVQDSVLIIDNKAKNKWLHPKNNKIKLKISCEQLKKIVAYQSCDIKTIEPITTYEFGIIIGGKVNMADLEFANSIVYCWNYIPCGGTLTFRGSAETLKIWSNAIMTVDAKKLQVKNAYVEHKGKNDLWITVSDYLKYTLTANGNIHCYGNPLTIDEVEDSGEGQLMLY